MSDRTALPPAPFIVGVGRSGTTLLRLMLDSHPEMCIPPETGFIPAATGRSRGAAGLRNEFFQTVTQFVTWEDFNLSPEEFFAGLKKIEPFDTSEGIRAFYRLYTRRFGKPRWGDKTPAYCLQMREIESVLPEARFIHIIRDGRDVALSVRPLWFAPGKDMTTLALDWQSRVEQTRQSSRRCLHYIEVRYENLVADAKSELKRICVFLDLQYHARMLRYFEGARARLDEVKTRYRPDGTILISKEDRLLNQRATSAPPDSSRVFRWKREMTMEERREFEKAAGNLLETLGYDR
ncbi:MAG: sulfotransferase family protein [Candidatus Binatia bacterium]